SFFRIRDHDLHPALSSACRDPVVKEGKCTDASYRSGLSLGKDESHPSTARYFLTRGGPMVDNAARACVWPISIADFFHSYPNRGCDLTGLILREPTQVWHYVTHRPRPLTDQQRDRATLDDFRFSRVTLSDHRFTRHPLAMDANQLADAQPIA